MEIIPPVALTEDQAAKVREIIETQEASGSSVIRRAVKSFLRASEGTQAEYISTDYAESAPFANIYLSAEDKAQVDALAEKYETSRNQVIRATVQFYFFAKKEG